MTGPAPDERVWVATARRVVTMHRPCGRETTCGRNCVDYGRQVTAAYAREQWAAQPCAKCWPVAS